MALSKQKEKLGSTKKAYGSKWKNVARPSVCLRDAEVQKFKAPLRSALSLCGTSKYGKADSLEVYSKLADTLGTPHSVPFPVSI